MHQMNQQSSDFTQLHNRIEQITTNLHLDDKAKRIAELEQQVSQPNFWDDSDAAQKLSQELGDLTKEQAAINELRQRIDNALEMSESDDAEIMQEELDSELRQITKAVDQLELQTYLSGPHDKSGAIISLHAGQGGTEAMDWTEMLFRMYLRYVEKQGWKSEITEMVRGKEAGIKSVVVEVEGRFGSGLDFPFDFFSFYEFPISFINMTMIVFDGDLAPQ